MSSPTLQRIYRSTATSQHSDNPAANHHISRHDRRRDIPWNLNALLQESHPDDENITDLDEFSSAGWVAALWDLEQRVSVRA
jgi:hypothetical protein